MDYSFLVAAGIAIGLAGVGVCIWQWMIARKSIEVLAKNPDLSGTLTTYTIIGIALVESAAIYALIIGLQIVGAESLEMRQAIGAALAVWLPGLAAWLWEALVVRQAIDGLLRNPEAKGKLLTSMILFVALVESAAIYGLILALQILG